MAINPEIRDHAYQFFVEEAPELLQTIEAELLTLNQSRSTTQIHTLMRAAHSIKGGAASVGLDTIATLAHRLENVFKALYSDALELDVELENQIFRAYDCLRLPLMEQITTGTLDSEQVLAIANPVFDQLEAACGDALAQTETYIPSSTELGIDMVASILEVDVVQGLDRLRAVANQPQDYEVAGELRAQTEVFAGFAELLDLPEFGAIATAVQEAVVAHPEQVLDILNLALTDFETNRHAILMGDRAQAAGPSAALVALTGAPDYGADSIADSIANSIEELIATPRTDSDTTATLFDELANIFGGPLAAEADLDDLDDLSLQPIDIAADSELAGLDESLVEAADAEAINREDAFEPFSEPASTAQLDISDRLASDAELIDLDNHLLEASDLPNSNLAINDTEINETEFNIAEINEIEINDIAINDTTIDDTVTSQESLADRYQNSLDLPLAANDSTASLSSTAFAQDSALLSSSPNEAQQIDHLSDLSHPTAQASQARTSIRPIAAPIATNLTIRVDSARLEKMNNLVGELAINRDALSLQNEQLQSVVRELLQRFSRFQSLVSHVRELSDEMLVAPERLGAATGSRSEGRNERQQNDFDRPFTVVNRSPALNLPGAEFDSLEMDRYGVLHPQLQEILENLVQMEETVEDVALFSRLCNQMLEQQRNRLGQLQDEIVWARMLPLGEVLNRFPRILRDLSTTYQKPVQLKLIGTNVLIEKAILEKLYDPLLHLLRNAFDHGIESVSLRQQHGKPAQGQIEIRAYHKGNQTVIEIRDDGQGLNLDRIRQRAIDLGWLLPTQAAVVPPAHLLELIFEPGFSTAPQVSELSGRGIGLDVVRAQLQAIKGSVTVTSSPGKGTTFTLYLPLTLTITRLTICLMGSTPLALPTDCIEEIIVPQAEQIKHSGGQRFLYWREQIIPAYRFSDLLNYACPLSETAPGRVLATVAPPQEWASPMLILSQDQHLFALEVDRLVTEQEFVIKPFGAAIAAPTYMYGCTIMGDGSLVPVVDGAALLSFNLSRTKGTSRSDKTAGITERDDKDTPPIAPQPLQLPTILVVDDAVTLRRTLALSLERAGFRVLQARDGREAITQLQQSPAVKLVVCDIEMPNMNGFEFLSYRRQDAELARIPVVMLTSRSNEKHRWLAMQLGATAYFTKPYLEQEFLSALQAILKEPQLEPARS